MDEIPGWALDIGELDAGSVLEYLRGSGGCLWPPYYFVTDTELILVERGLIRKSAYQVPLRQVFSISYRQGLLSDEIKIETAGGDLPSGPLKVGRSHRDQTRRFVAAVRGILTAE